MDILDYGKLPVQADPRILGQDISLSPARDLERVAHSPLKEDEFPKPGTKVAIDAEFVSLQQVRSRYARKCKCLDLDIQLQEELEIHSNGQRKVIRPAKMSLARVSVLRGQGQLAAVPFIDDHIHTSQPIADYLTEYSGIRGKCLLSLSEPMAEKVYRWRFRSQNLAAYVGSSQDRLQEAAASGRSGLHLCGPRFSE